MIEIVDSPKVKAPARDNLKGHRMSTKELAERRLAKEALRKAQTVLFSDGSKVYPDTLPGVGWVVETPGRNKHYWATKEIALQDVPRRESILG